MSEVKTTLVPSSLFLRQVKKLNKKDKQTARQLEKQLKLLIKNPYDSRLKTHKLSGKLKGRFAFSIAQDMRVVFRFIGSNKILLVAIGSHNQVYK